MIYVKDVMTRHVRTMGEESTISDAAKVMAKWKIGALVIVEGDKPTGMLTEGDVSRLVAKGLDLAPRLLPSAGRSWSPYRLRSASKSRPRQWLRRA